MALSLKKSKSILKEAKKDHSEENEDWTPVFEDDIPDDEKKVIAEAEELVEMAEEARDGGQEHPAIDKILFLAQVDGDSPSSSDDDEDEDEPEEPWDGYDKEKAGQIIRSISDLEDEELEDAYRYEQKNKNREPVIEALEEAASERRLEGAPESEVDNSDDYKPWKKYDEDSVKSIISQIKGMRPVSDEFWENMLKYEEENSDRARIKAEIEAKLNDDEEGDDVAEEPETQEESGEEYLSWDDLQEMDIDGLTEMINEYEEDPEEILGDVDDEEEAREIVAKHYEVEIPEEEEQSDDEPESESEREPSFGGEDYNWADLESYDLDDLKGVVKEKELGFRVSKKTGLDDLRVKIAEALEIEIEKPAEPPWRGYDKREAKQIIKKLDKLDDDELKAVFDYESENQARKSILKKLDDLAAERGLDPEEPEEEGEITDGGQDDEAPEEEIEEAEEEDEEKTQRRKARRRGKPKSEEPEEEEPDYDNLSKAIEDKVEEEHFAVPRPLPENISEMPFDLTELSETELRELHSANLNYFGRASYVSKIEKALAIACKNIADEYHDKALVDMEKIDPETEKDKSATQLKAEAESDPTVRRWRRRQHSHEEMRDSMKADADIYKQNLDSLSRDWTMRIDEMDHSGGLGPRGKAGAKASGKAAKKPPKKRR